MHDYITRTAAVMSASSTNLVRTLNIKRLRIVLNLLMLEHNLHRSCCLCCHGNIIHRVITNAQVFSSTCRNYSETLKIISVYYISACIVTVSLLVSKSQGTAELYCTYLVLLSSCRITRRYQELLSLQLCKVESSLLS